MTTKKRSFSESVQSVGNLRYFSLFSGIGCGELALKKIFPNAVCVGFSEINADSVRVYEQHFPNHKNFGDITKIDTSTLPEFDLLFGGSPCQGFSRAGVQLAFDDPRSRLFFEYVRILRSVKPRFFLLENVGSMKIIDRNVISEQLGCQPVAINSASLCAQNRHRLYWANFTITEPNAVGKGPTLASIVEPAGTVASSYTVTTNVVKNTDMKALITKTEQTVQAPYCFGLRRRPENRHMKAPQYKDMEVIVRTDGKANPVTTGAGFLQYVYDGRVLRTLTALECERLQCLPDNYTSVLKTDTKRIKVIGNGFTVCVIEHIFKNLKSTYDADVVQTKKQRVDRTITFSRT